MSTPTLQLEDVKRKHSLHDHSEDPKSEEAAEKDIVRTVVPERQFGIVVGDSGKGKSPCMYQMGVAAAAGVPFLGEGTTAANVLYFDFENGAAQSCALEGRIAQFLGLNGKPTNFLRWNADDCSDNFGKPGYCLEDIVREWSRAAESDGRPRLVIVDPLRYWLTNIENARYSDGEVQRARKLIREAQVSIYGVHHLRRLQGEVRDSIPKLEDDPRRWIQEMSRGALALVNGTDVRLGFDYADSFTSETTALVLAGFRRVRGQVGPIFMERVLDSNDGEPVGYERLSMVKMLGCPEHIGAFQSFPQRFLFTDAVKIFGKSNNATWNLLKKCENLKLLKKEGRHYVKVAQ